jgi:hypothetical protein
MKFEARGPGKGIFSKQKAELSIDQIHKQPYFARSYPVSSDWKYAVYPNISSEQSKFWCGASRPFKTKHLPLTRDMKNLVGHF